LKGKGVVDLPLVYNFAYVVLEDLGLIGKEVVEGFYGRPASKRYSYLVFSEAITIATETWHGLVISANKPEWPGLPHEAHFYIPLFGPFSRLAGVFLMRLGRRW
jgi:hypothetical protein